MKKPKITTETLAPTAKVEQPVAPKPMPKKPSVAKASEKKAEVTAPKTETEQSPAAVTTEVTPKTPSPEQPASEKVKAKVKAPKPASTKPELSMSERVGLTAGSIWHYLSENGGTSVAQLVKELAEEEKIIQRSIGWLAQEDKITIESADRVETIALYRLIFYCANNSLC